MQPTIVWLRQDLRLHDHEAFQAASKLKQPVIIVYIDDHAEHDMPIGKYQKNWLHLSLQKLERDLKEEGLKLHYFKGDSKKVLLNILEKTKATSILWHRCYEPKLMQRDADLKKTFKSMNLNVETFAGFLLNEPWTVLNNQDSYFKVFTPFWKAASKNIVEKPPLPKAKLIAHNFKLDSLELEDLKLSNNFLPTVEDLWHVGEKAAMKRLHHFLEHGVSRYAIGRDYPSIDATSRLSPNLHFGEISVRQIIYYTLQFLKDNKSKEMNVEVDKFFSELGWREFSYNLLYHFQKLPTDPFKPQYADFPWVKNPEALKLWQEGKTGFPIIDAGMRQLKQIGWMHNRVRMIVASFMIKNLMLDWHEGEKWFWDHLLDADLASNSASWQWVFGSGADAAPYFRVFNPILQSAKFDPEGKYIKEYIPELKDMDPKYIHDPSSAPTTVLRQAGIDLDKTYPKAICDLNATRDEVLKAYKSLKVEE